MKSIRSTGFTLLEILIVVATIGILSSIVIIAINPARNLAQTRNGQRYADISAILGAIYQYSLDHNGTIPPEIGNGEHEICMTGTTCDIETMVDLHALTDNGRYLTTIPQDPTGSTNDSTGYTITRFKFQSRIIISAPHAELGETITISR